MCRVQSGEEEVRCGELRMVTCIANGVKFLQCVDKAVESSAATVAFSVKKRVTERGR